MVTFLVAFCIGMVLVGVALPWFNQYFDVDISFDYWENLSLILLLLGVGLFTGLLAGAYPAFFASGMNAIDALKGEWKRQFSGKFPRKGLIVLQFTASIVLIARTVVIWRQIQFMKNQDLHFNKENTAAISLNYENFKFQNKKQTKTALETMLHQLENETSIASIAIAESVPGKYSRNYNSFTDVDAPDQEPVSLRQLTVTNHFFSTLGIEFALGRDFSSSLASDSNAVIINEAAMKAFGLPPRCFPSLPSS